MVGLVAAFGSLLLWGVAIVAIDARAQHRLRQQTERRKREEAEVVDEAERWLKDHPQHH